MHYDIPQFSYHLAWRSRGYHTGRHASIQRGMGMEFRGLTNLLSYPDPRRIDIRQTIKDPLEQIYVRIYNQKGATPVFAIGDISGSMGFGQGKSKIQLMTDIAQSIAVSATSNSDPFGFIAFDDQVRDEYLSSSSLRPQMALDLLQGLSTYQPPKVGGMGLSQTFRHLPRERSLIFLISDFHMPIDALEDALLQMLHHHIVPVVLWDADEYRNLPEFGIINVQDAESGDQRIVLLRKELRDQIVAKFEQRRKELNDLFLRYDMPPFYVEGTFDCNLMSEYFYQFSAA